MSDQNLEWINVGNIADLPEGRVKNGDRARHLYMSRAFRRAMERHGQPLSASARAVGRRHD